MRQLLPEPELQRLAAEAAEAAEEESLLEQIRPLRPEPELQRLAAEAVERECNPDCRKKHPCHPEPDHDRYDVPVHEYSHRCIRQGCILL